ncbi:hypothetical protein BU23DRAFT_440692, partial [Bimuria novae-zelandiae CBS 107.79]
LFGSNVLFVGSADPGPQFCGSFSTLSSCVVTLGLCVWSAVHVSIPEQDTKSNRSKWNPLGWFKPTTLKNSGWMVLGLFAPKLV